MDTFSMLCYQLLYPSNKVILVKVNDGLLYIITDVEDLFEWMAGHLERHPLFQRLSEEELKQDPVVAKLYESTEEGQKVSRAQGQKWCSVFRRIPDPYQPPTDTSSKVS